MIRTQAARPALSTDDALSVASSLLAVGALWALPWPGLAHGAALIWPAWALLELAFLLPLLPAWWRARRRWCARGCARRRSAR